MSKTPRLWPAIDSEVPVVASSTIMVSCASGKFASLPVPPEDVAQEDDPAQVVSVPTRYTGLVAGNVMPVLPPQLPAPAGEAGEAAPASAMSSKSQLSADITAAVSVRAVPAMADRTYPLEENDDPAQVSVPLIVWSPPRESVVTPAELATSVKLLNVCADKIVRVPEPDVVNE